MAINEFVKNHASTINQKIYFGDAAPTAGTWKAGDIVINTSASATKPYAWLCVTAGTPGTWRGLYPSAVGVYYAAAVPTTGTYAKGDIIWNTAPAAGGAPGWICTTAGDLAVSGVVKAMANLAA